MKRIIIALLMAGILCFSACGNKTQQNSQTLGEMSKAYNKAE